MQIDIFRKHKDNKTLIEACLNQYLVGTQKPSLLPWDIDAMAQHIADIIQNAPRLDEDCDIDYLVAHTESEEEGTLLYDNELREIYEVLTAKGFRWGASDEHQNKLDKAKEFLIKYEWMFDDNHCGDFCFYCDNPKDRGHKESCELKQLLESL